MTAYRLVVREGKDAGRVFPLRGPSITLGRPGCEVEGAIEFQEPSVSRVHAVLQWKEEEGCYELSNRSFTSPAQVDGQPAVSGARLAHGSRIQLGALVAEIMGADEKPAAEPEPLMGVLEVVQGPGGPGARLEVYRRRTLIGRGSQCELQLSASGLGREHAVLEWYEKLPVLLPLTSRTILVNGQPIPRGTFLGPNDWIILDTGVSLKWIPARLLKLEKAAEEASAPPPAAVAEAPPEPPGGAQGERWFGAPLPARAAFFSELGERLGAGQPIQRAVREAATARLPMLAEPLAEAILAGRPLADALERCPSCFAPYELGVVAAGEEAGILDAQLPLLAQSLLESMAFRSRLFGWLVPVMLLLGLGVPMLLLRPTLMNRGPEAYGAEVAGVLLGTGLLGLLLVGLRRHFARSMHFRRMEERLLERLPLLGRALRLRAGARFLQALGPLLSAGLQVQRAALLAAGCTGSNTHAIALLDAARSIESGTPVLDALAPTGLLPPDILDEVGKGEEAGDLPERLAAAAATLQQAAAAAMHRAFPAVIAGVAVLLMALMLVLVSLASAG